jgi:hypothetical protein
VGAEAADEATAAKAAATNKTALTNLVIYLGIVTPRCTALVSNLYDRVRATLERRAARKRCRVRQPVFAHITRDGAVAVISR